MLLCKKIKIEVSDQDAEALEFMQAKCRGLYNWFVMKLRNGQRWNLERAKKSLRESKAFDPDLRFVYGKLLAEVYFRLDKAMQGFFRRLEAGEKAGFPRVKPRHQFFTLCYPAMYLEVQGNTFSSQQVAVGIGDPNATLTSSRISPKTLLSTSTR